MYAGHFAAGLALRARAPRVPVAVLLAGAFLLDFLWIAFGVSHLDKTAWDDWSHSLVMSMIWATLFAVFFWRLGRRAFIIVWLAVIPITCWTCGGNEANRECRKEPRLAMDAGPQESSAGGVDGGARTQGGTLMSKALA
jgi:hypothetical protein